MSSSRSSVLTLIEPFRVREELRAKARAVELTLRRWTLRAAASVSDGPRATAGMIRAISASVLRPRRDLRFRACHRPAGAPSTRHYRCRVADEACRSPRPAEFRRDLGLCRAAGLDVASPGSAPGGSAVFLGRQE